MTLVYALSGLKSAKAVSGGPDFAHSWVLSSLSDFSSLLATGVNVCNIFVCSCSRPFLDAYLTLPDSAIVIPIMVQTVGEDARFGQRCMNRMTSSAISEPGYFFGFMSDVAGHRAVLMSSACSVSPSGRERVLSEPDIYTMRVMAIEKMNEKLQHPVEAVTDAAFDIVICLISSAVGHIVQSHFI